MIPAVALAVWFAVPVLALLLRRSCGALARLPVAPILHLLAAGQMFCAALGEWALIGISLIWNGAFSPGRSPAAPYRDSYFIVSPGHQFFLLAALFLFFATVATAIMRLRGPGVGAILVGQFWLYAVGLGLTWLPSAFRSSASHPSANPAMLQFRLFAASMGGALAFMSLVLFPVALALGLWHRRHRNP